MVQAQISDNRVYTQRQCIFTPRQLADLCTVYKNFTQTINNNIQSVFQTTMGKVFKIFRLQRLPYLAGQVT